ncbi:FUSC family protein [Loktanella sp. SALINAS62]|uniref:FUSC family protein n=1 Tax=Loktanella sp. SALINAS62 TaxID=2706124 RepID=UPI001B8D9C1C|nr:FUSC family protein [Loktanella sp. SALINAS62]MBS1301357.1 FUSC family protein [Loktanella sp. SALINAS62]
MYVPPRPKREDDPLFAVRLGLVVVASYLAMALINPIMGAIVAVLPFGLVAGQRKGFNFVRAISAPIAFGVMVWLMASLVAIVRPIPALMLVVMGLVLFLGYYATRRTGSGVGMLIIVAAVMMSIAGMETPALLNIFRDGFLLGCGVALVIIPALYLLLPTATREKHEDAPRPSAGHHGAGSLIRAIVTLGLCFWFYAVLPVSDLILAVAAVFPLIFPTREEAFAEAGERSLATFYGAIAAVGILAFMMLVSAHFVVLLCLVFLVTFYFGERMIDGKRSASVYQFAASAAVSIVATVLSSGSPDAAVLVRVALTFAGSIGAAFLVAFLEWVLLSPIRHADNYSPHPAVQRRRLGQEL